MKQKRLEWIDIMKGIGILLVIVGHYLSFSYLPFIIYSFHMPLFVWVSGYLFKEDLIKKKTIHTLKKIGIPYLYTYIVVVVGALLVEIAKIFVKNQHFLLLDFFKTKGIAFLFGYGNSTSQIEGVDAIWFLASLMVAEIVLNVLLKLKNRFFIGVIVVIVYLLGAFLHSKFDIPLYLAGGGTAFLLWLFIGMLFREKEIHFKTWMIFVAFFVWTIVLVIEIKTNTPLNIDRIRLYGLENVGALAAIIVIRAVCERVQTFSLKFLKWMGRNSLYILCVHSFDISILSNRLSRMFESQFVSFCIKLVIDLVGAYVLLKLLEIIKCRKASFIRK